MNIRTIWDLISCSEAILFVVPFALFIQSHDIHHIGRLAALFTIMFGGEAIKFNLIGDTSPRPSGANNCDMFCSNGPQGGKPGMPSTHMAVATAFSTLYMPWPSPPYQIVAGFVILVLAMAAARYYKQCHTPMQIIVGSLYGIVGGLLYRAIENNILNV
jgi:membrane-associated phospholipid phosphatase